jgi:hypothetical protein
VIDYRHGREARISALRAAAAERILVLDGSWGARALARPNSGASALPTTPCT